MEQEQIRDQLVELHNVIAGGTYTCEEIVRNRTVEPDISLIHCGEFGGMIPISTGPNSSELVKKYGTLEDKFDYGTPKNAR